MYPFTRSDIYEREQKIQTHEKMLNDLSVQNETLVKQINEKELKIINLEKDIQVLVQNSKRINNIEEEIQRKDKIIQTLKSAGEKKNEELLRANSNLSALKKENDENQDRISKKRDEIENLKRKLKYHESAKFFSNQNIEIPPQEPPQPEARSHQLFVNIVEPPKQVTKLHETVVESILDVKTKLNTPALIIFRTEV